MVQMVCQQTEQEAAPDPTTGAVCLVSGRQDCLEGHILKEHRRAKTTDLPRAQKT